MNINVNANNNKTDKLEILAREGFQAAKAPELPDNWQATVIASIKQRRRKKVERETTLQLLLPLRLSWRFAAAAVIFAAVLCLALYVSIPETSSIETFYTLNETSVDYYDNYVEIAARL